VAGDANSNGEMYPDQSLYSVDSVPKVVKRINATFKRADEIQWSEGKNDTTSSRPSWPTRKPASAACCNAFELMKAMIEAGAAGVHFEDQLAAVKKCGHMGGKVLVPTREASPSSSRPPGRRRVGVPTVLLARTDAEAADLVTSDVDDNDKPFLTGERTVEGFYRTRNGLEQAISRGLAYAEYADMIWCETGKPDLAFAKAFAERSTSSSRQAAGLQLLAVVQLEEEPGRRHDRQVPARAGRDGLQVPVHHAGRLPQPQLLDVQPGPRLCAQPDERLRRAAGGRVRRGREGLHRREAPARGRHRLLRRR
jgi:isocitrate lyase